MTLRLPGSNGEWNMSDQDLLDSRTPDLSGKVVGDGGPDLGRGPKVEVPGSGSGTCVVRRVFRRPTRTK